MLMYKYMHEKSSGQCQKKEGANSGHVYINSNWGELTLAPYLDEVNGSCMCPYVRTSVRPYVSNYCAYIRGLLTM